MGHLPALIHPDRADATEVVHYQDLLRQSADARKRGDHWSAQQLASAAHRWEMQELARLRHLAYEEEQLRLVAKRLQEALDRDPSCATLSEFRERHPEHKRLFTAVQEAENRVSDLARPLAQDALAVPPSRVGTRGGRQ
ncbi:MAG TPA: hypothetical protein VMU89_07265 [Thermomicrobiaceae bacterium]|nr:hypothetical protein [Thermomicrobiaceae bacterium]